MKRNFIFIIILIGCIIFLIHFIKEPKEKKYFPDFKGWIRVSKFEVFNNFNLKDQVGIAEKTYFKYGFRNLFHQEYVKGYNYIIVDIFKMKSKKSAEELIEYIKNPNDKVIKLGDMATKSPTQVIFLKKSYYVRVFTYNTGYKTEKILLEFAKYINSKIR